MPRITAIIVAGGGGSRFGGPVSKQFLLLKGMPVLRRSLLPFLRHPKISAVQVVMRAEDQDAMTIALQGLPVLPPVVGGVTRQDSVRAGLNALAAQKPDFVLVHDAARPFVSLALIDRVIAALEAGAQAVLPALPVAETLKFARGPQVESTQSREHLHGAQTPQGFHFETLHKLHAEAKEALTDDTALAEAAGIPVQIVTGERRNVKITTPEDWDFAEQLCSSEEETRTGQGFDVHRLVEHPEGTPAARRIIHIGGLSIPHSHRAEGHSDADVALHALVDGILGALGEGDIGTHFPPSEPEWRGADSARFVLHALHLLRLRGGRLLHADITLICEAPKIGPHREAMRARIAELLDAPLHRISVKATTTEKLGFTGRGEGIAAQAIVTIAMPVLED